MEHELDSQKPAFTEKLTALMETASIVKIYGWSRAKEERAVIDLIKKHEYTIESYSILNFAKLLPGPNGAPGQSGLR